MFYYVFFMLGSYAFAVPLARSQAPAAVPSFVTKYAPLVYLDSRDAYLPSDIASQLAHTQPEVDYVAVNGTPTSLTLDNLDTLNDHGGKDVYLTSEDNVEDDPSWLFGVTPDSNGKTGDATTCAIIVNDHGNGSVDAFYMYFWAFNWGGEYLDLNLGNHVGDWEHNMIRFKDGSPQALWYSQHAEGQAFKYDILEKQGNRPIAYAANGTHAIYAVPGTHDHTIPNVDLPEGPLEDHTNNGSLWDPTLSAYYYSFDANTSTFAAYDDSTPVNWLYFTGHWGDEQYKESDPRQEMVLGIDKLAKYVGGPTGPRDKQLQRDEVCPDDGNLCIVRSSLTP